MKFGASIRAGEGREGSLAYAIMLVGASADIVIHLEDVEDFMVTFIAQVRCDANSGHSVSIVGRWGYHAMGALLLIISGF